MIGIGFAYVLAGLVFAVIALFSALDGANPKRWMNAAFWGLFAASFLFGNVLGDFANGVLVIALVLVGGIGGLGIGAPATTSAPERAASARRLGERVFLPILAIPVVSIAGTLLLAHIRIGAAPLVDPKQVTVISLALGVIIAMVLAQALIRAPLRAGAEEGRRLMDQVGWAAILPQLLAALGAVFALAGVGGTVSRLIGAWIPLDNRVVVVAVYCVGMAIFTLIMGNAFAAFPVLTAGIGAPLIVGKFGGDPAVMGAVGMLAGYCGTLMTPMASQNIVPAALLELRIGAVIRAQTPTALFVLLGNILLMEFLVFRF
ncbi:MAG: DUF979 domain-containing protein [Caulobacteraceae bacterium]